MAEHNSKEQELLQELEEYNKERDRIRLMLGNIGGKSYSKIDTLLNIVFISCIITLFILEITTHFLPTYISLELGVLLVSVKIVWMIHSQQKMYHFQFWILNSIEFRQNELIKKINSLEKQVQTTSDLKE